MGKYCKAYPLSRFREFNGWKENAENFRKEKKTVNGAEAEVSREITDSSFAYLQENYTVTDGIFIDENIIFDDVTPEWIDFCVNTLKFEQPVYESAATPEG
jgi:hypothetical protein